MELSTSLKIVKITLKCENNRVDKLSFVVLESGDTARIVSTQHTAWTRAGRPVVGVRLDTE